MKTINKILFASAFSMLLFSCSKSDPGTNSLSGGSMSAKVDGTTWSATLAVQATKANGVLSVAGTGSAGQINITLGTYTGPGTYTLGPAGGPSNTAIYTLTTAPFTAHSASGVLGSGTVTVTSDTNGRVEGTFNFDGKNNSGPAITTKLITDGNFSAKY